MAQNYFAPCVKVLQITLSTWVNLDLKLFRYSFAFFEPFFRVNLRNQNIFNCFRNLVHRRPVSHSRGRSCVQSRYFKLVPALARHRFLLFVCKLEVVFLFLYYNLVFKRIKVIKHVSARLKLFWDIHRRFHRLLVEPQLMSVLNILDFRSCEDCRTIELQFL